MKIDLYKIFEVEEGEEFKLGNGFYNGVVYKVSNNNLWSRCEDGKDFTRSTLYINELLIVKEVIKLPKKKEFTDDELCILRNVDKKLKWIARDESNNLYVYKNKPTKINRYWDVEYGDRRSLKVFSHLFQQIQWEDEEPVFIDDYVERSVQNDYN